MTILSGCRSNTGVLLNKWSTFWVSNLAVSVLIPYNMDACRNPVWHCMSSYMTELYFGNLALVKYTISFLTLIFVAFHAYTKGIWLHFKFDWQYWEGKNTCKTALKLAESLFYFLAECSLKCSKACPAKDNLWLINRICLSWKREFNTCTLSASRSSKARHLPYGHSSYTIISTLSHEHFEIGQCLSPRQHMSSHPVGRMLILWMQRFQIH